MANSGFKTALVFLAGTAALTGCSQLGSVADGVWGGTKTFAGWVASPVTSLLRDTPESDVMFAAEEVEDSAAEDVVTYAATTSPYAGGTVELYAQPDFTTAPQMVSSTSSYYGVQTELAGAARSVSAEPVQSIEFVRLDGQSPSMTDWQNCEVTSGGYWRVDASGGGVNPQFEVCMRNKNYVLKQERASYASAQSGGYTPLP